MNKKISRIMAGVCIVCIIVGGCSGNKVKEIFKINYDNENKNLEYVSIQKIRDTKDLVIKELEEGKYGNLIADNMYVSISSENEVSNIRENAPGLYHGITDPLEMYEIQMEIIHHYLGENLIEEYILDMSALYDNEYGGRSYYEHEVIVRKLKEKKYDEICSTSVYGYSLPFMFYGAWTNVEGDNRYVHVSPDFNKTVAIKGKLMELSGTTSEDPETNYEALEIYYPEGENIDDVYELQNGKISIRDAIKFVEDYFKN